MPRGYRQIQVSFAGGELSPEMWSRYDDARFRSGAARMRNMISHPRGSVARRPGFELVRKIKDGTRMARLLPFRFSLDQTHAIEMSRAVVDGRDVGYFRFHTNGGTLLQPIPPGYRAPFASADIDDVNDEWDLSGTHDFETGDPIVFTMEPSTDTVTFDAATDEVINTAHGFAVNDSVLFRTTGTLPPELEPGRIYYVRNVSANRFRLGKTRTGQNITFSSAGTPTTTVACLPRPLTSGGATFNFDVNRTYYAIDRGASSIAVAATKADALANVALDWQAGQKGTAALGDIRIHYDYRNGSVAMFGTAPARFPYYCRKIPWGTPNAQKVNLNDHLDHAPPSPIYWVRQPGTTSTVTFDLGTDRVNWTSHGLSDGDPVTFTTTGALPTEITAGVAYYVRNKTTNDFQLSASVPGPVLDLTGAPAGTHTAFANGIYEVPHEYAEAVLFEINHTQSADILTLVHLDRPIAELRRLGATNWVLEEVVFNAAVTPPTGVEATSFFGEGDTVSAVTAATPAVLTTANAHLLQPGDSVLVIDVGTLANAHYIVRDVPTGGTTLTLKFVESGGNVGSGSTTVGPTSRIRTAAFSADWNETYVVTALDDNNEESPASAEFTVENNLLVTGAYNTVTWDPVDGAKRYRVYKEVNGLFGFIGEVDAPTTTFRDDNIGPDLSITPPILDDVLRKSFTVTFDLTRDVVEAVDHGLEAGAPVLFDTDGGLPSGIDYGVTYYVLNPSEDEFQIASTPTGEVPVNLFGSQSGIHTAISGQFPAAVAYFEQRRVFGGSRLRPQDFWLTASSTETDLSYRIPTQDSDRIQNRLAARERSQIRHAVPIGHLLLLTSAAEYRLTALDSDALTPGSVSARAPTHIGTSPVAPVLVNNAILFPAARGGHVREMGFLEQVSDYVTGDVSLRAAHLFDEWTIVQMAYQQAPQPVVWAVSSAGTLLGFSYVPEEQVAGWHEHDIGGTIESCTVVAEGDEDRLYTIAKRGSTRYVERMGPQSSLPIAEGFFVDWGVSYSGTAVSSVFVPHLAGLAVVFLADGVVGSGTVSGAGVLTLPTAASTVHVGLTYTSQLHTLPLGLQLDAAAGVGRTKNISHVWLRVRDSGAFDVGPDLTALSPSEAPAAGTLLTQLVQVTILGEWDLEGQIYVQQDDPLPLIVAGLTLEVASGG